MKKHSWTITLQIVLFFSLLFYFISFRGDRGDLHNSELLRLVYQPLKSFSGWWTDQKFRFRGDRPVSNKIVIASIDIDSVEKFGRWPWSRRLIAGLVDEIATYQPKVIGLDLLFAESDKEISEALREELGRHNLRGLLQSFDNDAILAATLKKHQDKVVLGLLSAKQCQPLQIPESGMRQCPVWDPAYSRIMKGAQSENSFSRFLIRDFVTPAHWELGESPLLVSANPVFNFEPIQNAVKHLGHFDVNPDPDGVNRRSVLVRFANSLPVPSFALEVARVARGESLELKISDDQKIESLKFRDSKTLLRVDPVGRLAINSLGPTSVFTHVSIVDLLNGEKNAIVLGQNSSRFADCQSCRVIGRVRDKSQMGVRISKEELFKDAIVLVGTTNLGVDFRALSNQPYAAGVEGHAMVLENILSQNAFVPQSRLSLGLAVVALLSIGALGLAILIQILPSVPAVAVFFASLLLLFVVDFRILFAKGINLDSGLVYVQFVLLATFLLLNKYVVEEANRKFLKRAFSRFVSPEIVKALIDNPARLSLTGEKRELSILFADIRGFMPLSSTLEPQVLHSFLNDYHETMTKVIIEKGTLDKYIGDSVMAFWGAPLENANHAADACRAAIKMVHELRSNNPYFKEKYGHQVSIGIGINSGPVIVGNLGSKEVFSYTVIGDDVNLASRIERLTRVYNVNILTTRATLEACQSVEGKTPPHRLLDFVQTVGAETGAEIYQILDEAYPPEALDCYAKAFQAYLSKNFSDAIVLFEQSQSAVQEVMNRDDAPSVLMIDRCREFLKSPPPDDWDGVKKMLKK